MVGRRDKEVDKNDTDEAECTAGRCQRALKRIVFRARVGLT
jgi:hypothetical protein